MPAYLNKRKYVSRYRKVRRRRNMLAVTLILTVLLLVAIAVFGPSLGGLFVSPNEPPPTTAPSTLPATAPVTAPLTLPSTAPTTATATLPVTLPQATGTEDLWLSDVNGTLAAFENDPRLLAEHLVSLNAKSVQIDLKNTAGEVTYLSQARDDVMTEVPFDLTAFVQAMEEKQIRVVGRLSCFRDDTVTRKKTSWGVQHESGVIWLDNEYKRWLDPYDRSALDYLLALVDEAVEAGVHGLVLDYAFFPFRGIMDVIDFGDVAQTKPEAILSFVDQVRDRLTEGMSLGYTVPGVAFYHKTRYTNSGLSATDLSALPVDYLLLDTDLTQYPDNATVNGIGLTRTEDFVLACLTKAREILPATLPYYAYTRDEAVTQLIRREMIFPVIHIEEDA